MTTQRATLPKKPGTGESILIVDDVSQNLRMLSVILSRAGHTVRTADSGAHALESVQLKPPDLILLDIMMPGMDGYAVCEQLKADEQTREIPILFISALDATEDKLKAFTVGGVDYITKPFRGKEVLARVKTHLTLRREIAERIRAEQVLQRQAERLQILHEIDQSILAAQSPGAIALAAIGRIRQLIPCQRAIALAVTRTGRVETLAVESSGTINMDADANIYREIFETQPMNRGLVQGCDDLDGIPRHLTVQQALYAAGARSYVAVPLFIHGELVGSLNLEADRPGVFTADHVTIASEVAVLLAVAIRQAQLHEQTRLEKQKSQALLLNILPASVAQDLMEKGKAAPQSFENVTVYFSDIVGFTSISTQYEPAFLIDELNDIFTAFDNNMEKNHCERIKTIGDAYMAVCGMPEENENHACNMIQSAIENVAYLRERNAQAKVKWQIRVGIHSGAVVGGVVGIKKYIYDVFGDTVNTAARMESHSEPMRINVSETTHRFAQDQFPFVERKEILVKGKGDMKMYFVDQEES